MEGLALVEDHPTVRQLARIALANLGQPIRESAAPANSTTSRQDDYDISSLLRTLGLERYTEVLIRNEVTSKNIIYLVEEDLSKMAIELGPRRQLLNYIAARLRNQNNAIQEPLLPPAPQQPRQNGEFCLICCDAPSKVCFVPCGHVVSCELCARILVARGDACIICRSPITHTVVPLYL